MTKRIYTEKDKLKVIKLHLEGKFDREIVHLTGFSSSWIQKVTSEYWKEKMNQNKLSNEKQ